jgi:hypothetical protein
MINLDLYQQLLDDPTYKSLTKDLSEEEKKALEEYMKQFMDVMQENLMSPFATLASDPTKAAEFRKKWEEKLGK